MKLTEAGLVRKSFTLVCAMYLIGTVLYSGLLGWKLFADGIIPDREWWQHLLAPFVIAFAWLAIEAIGNFVGNGFTFNDVTQTKWRRKAGIIGMFFLLAAVLIGIPLYQISKS